MIVGGRVSGYPKLEKRTQFDEHFFSNGLVQPPTRKHIPKLENFNTPELLVLGLKKVCGAGRKHKIPFKHSNRTGSDEGRERHIFVRHPGPSKLFCP